MSARRDVLFLFDLDNTLLDNDAVVRDYRAHLVREPGAEAAEHYWTLFEKLRREIGYADYLGALQRYRLDHFHDPEILAGNPPAESSIAGIGELLAYDSAAGPRPGPHAPGRG